VNHYIALSSKHLTHPKFRSDIDGLRAVAILSVIFGHAFPLFVPGGFVGVDIFFVISGFLISSIIYDNIDKNNFSFHEFYSRRIRRIFPALILVLTFCLLFGWGALFSYEFSQLGKHIGGGAGFVSNFILKNEVGYFDNLAETKPLLHLWSLAVEEQFYIIWPIAIFIMTKLRLDAGAVTLVFTVISFCLSIQTTYGDQKAAFYLPYARFWELSAGSLLAYSTLYPENKGTVFWKTVCGKLSGIVGLTPGIAATKSVIGFALILVSILFLDRTSPFPGWRALFPTLGAVLIISSGATSWFNKEILSGRLIGLIGRISFPLYLWHWPLLSFATILEGQPPPRPPGSSS